MDEYSDVKIPAKLKQTKFPVARIKRIMQKDEDVGKVAQATPIVISKALELFLAQLVNDTANVTQSRGAKRVEAYHLKHAIDTIEMFDFLKELVEAVPDPSAGGTIPIVEPSAPKASGPRSRANTGADVSDGLSDEDAMSEEEEEVPPPKKKRAPRRKKADPEEDGEDGEEKPKKKRAPRKKKEVGEDGEVRKATRAPRGSGKGKKVSERTKKKVLAPGEALAMVVDPQELPPHNAQFKGRWQNAGAGGEDYDEDEAGFSSGGGGSGYD